MLDDRVTVPACLCRGLRGGLNPNDLPAALSGAIEKEPGAAAHVEHAPATSAESPLTELKAIVIREVPTSTVTLVAVQVERLLRGVVRVTVKLREFRARRHGNDVGKPA